MKKPVLLVAVSAVVFSGLIPAHAMKGLLERKVWYRTGGTNGEAQYWALYFGDFDVTLMRKFPGEDSLPVKAGMNFSLLSSGYIEGSGYCEKGKISAEARLAVKVGTEVRGVEIDSVEAIYDFGRRIRLSDGTDGDLVLDIEGTPIVPRKLLLRKYKFTQVDGERSLKEDDKATDLRLEIFGFTKDAITKVTKP